MARESLAKRLGLAFRGRASGLATTEAAGKAVAADDALPVVARLAIEIRSDGSRTIARGAMHDAATGQEVAIEIQAGSVLELGAQLTSQLRHQLLLLARKTLPDTLMAWPRRLLARRGHDRG